LTTVGHGGSRGRIKTIFRPKNESFCSKHLFSQSMKEHPVTSHILMAGFSVFITTSLIAQELEVPYHCPSLEDIRFSSPRIVANTCYNNQNFGWYSDEIFFNQFVDIEFSSAVIWDCSDNNCSVACHYKVDNSNYGLRLAEIFGPSKVTRIAGENWHDGTCTAKHPEECVFRVAPRF
jgi:hypothetical protein